ncbi:phospholipase SGR2 isoform X5 [Manihot esculenta]|uniref:phospholipase SGR2 isoform X5 n=1 Tax=Manihot esculenta TaxID=3983 RepID=UPI001CC641E2|nr:phospholipase SGR2 isoform X5 [Manihot esculenta]
MADSKANPGAPEETSPDSLKNTPSNIARLEDVIEHCKGRQKYLAQTRSPSDGSDVRWYFCKVPLAENELAASIPRTETVGKGDYFRFGMRDSLAIEASFLQREEELLSSWWKEYAECSEGPGSRSVSREKLDMQKSVESAQAAQLYEAEEERVGVPVKGGLYEVDLVKRRCFPVYWNGENRRVLRGHWFARKAGLDWLPLREDVAEQLEIAYRRQVWRRRRFQPTGLFAARIDLQGSTPGLHALFTGEDDTWEAWLNVDTSGFSSIISLSRNGIKLRRGYSASHSAKPTQDELRQQQEEEMDDYCSQVPVRHVVFMVHGIGQRLEKSNLVDDVGNFRHITASLAERHLTSHQRSAQRVLFIPCQWRKGLKLSGETAVEKITLDGVRGLRVMLSATVHDVLYYMSPIYCQDIINSIDSLRARIAELESQSSIKDIHGGLHQENTVDATAVKQQMSEKLPCVTDDEPKSFTPYIKYTKLEFKVDTFFAVGSPLGVFLALRNIRIGIGRGQEYWEENINEEMPACRQMFNIFHPFDPVAYRVEPLVCKEYITKRPVIIPYHKGGKRLHIGFQEFTEDLAARSQAVMDHLNFVKFKQVKVRTVCQSRSMDGLEERAENVHEKEERTYGSLMMERLTGSEEGRIDHTLQDKTFEHPYLQAIGSHTNYWRDCDTALFILKHLYKDIPEDPNSLQGSSGHNLKDESSSTGWIDRSEIKEEELPLTFSNRMMVKNFSRKAKKFMKMN